MEKKYVLLTLFVFVFLLTNIFDGVGFCLRVTPDAFWQQGFGIDTPAGSGRHLGTPNTNVLKVTNLNDSGAGSLRDALLNQDSPKVIIFEVSGNIALQSNIRIGGRGTSETKGSYITIAGQTAPSPGITLKDYGITVDRNCHDILIQHIRIRPGDTSLIELGCPNCEKWQIQNCITLDDHYSEGLCTPPYNIVIDHCSLSWSGDINIISGADDMTFSNNIISEALSNPLHPKGPHSKGFYSSATNSGVAGGLKVAIIKNLMAHNVDRNPNIAAGQAVIANNLIYDIWEGPTIFDQSENRGTIKVSIIGNYIIETSLTKYCMLIMGGSQEGTQIYLSNDNFFDGKVQTDPWNIDQDVSCFDQRRSIGEPAIDVPEAARASSPPVWPSGYTTMTAADAKTYVLANVGARPADRDSVDVRIVNDVKNGTGGIIASQNDVGGWPNLAKNTRTLTVPSNPNEVQASGYTKLEEWLHEFSNTVEGKPGRPGTFTY